MRCSLTALALSTVCVMSLSACATAPKTGALTAGISDADLNRPYAAGNGPGLRQILREHPSLFCAG